MMLEVLQNVALEPSLLFKRMEHPLPAAGSQLAKQLILMIGLLGRCRQPTMRQPRYGTCNSELLQMSMATH